MSRWAFVLAVLVFGLGLTALGSGEQAKRNTPQKAFDQSAPEGIADLRAMQEQVKKVIAQVTPAVVAVQFGEGIKDEEGNSVPYGSSGVVIDDEGHVLTAGHVSGQPGRACVLIFPDGKRVKGKTLGHNVGIDSGLIQITDKGKFPFVAMGDSSKVKVNDWVIALGHPGGLKPTRSTVVRLGRVRRTTKDRLQTDCSIVGGDSGGPLFDVQGRVVGIHNNIGPPIDDNSHVPVNAYKADWDRLARGDRWGGFEPFLDPRPANTAYLGVVFDRDESDLKIDEVAEGTPAEKAGLKTGDVIVAVDDVKLKNRSGLFDFMGKKKPDDEVTVVVTRNGKEVKLEVKLGKRPS